MLVGILAIPEDEFPTKDKLFSQYFKLKDPITEPFFWVKDPPKPKKSKKKTKK
jgi:hypothetical protein